MKKTLGTIKLALWAAISMVLMSAVSAMAFTAPAAGSLGYTAYDVIITQGLNGAFGYVGGALIALTGIIFGLQNKLMIAISCLIFGGLLAGTASLLTTLGATF